MANALFNPYKASRLTESPSVNMASDTIRIALVDTGTYAFRVFCVMEKIVCFDGDGEEVVADGDGI